MPVARLKTINPWNAYLARQELRYYEASLNQFLPWQGRSDITVRFSTDPDGYTPEGLPDTLFGPYAMIEATEGGWYYAEISSDDFTALLMSRVGETIYQVVEGSYGTYYFGLSDVQPLLVVNPRAPLPGSP